MFLKLLGAVFITRHDVTETLSPQAFGPAIEGASIYLVTRLVCGMG